MCQRLDVPHVQLRILTDSLEAFVISCNQKKSTELPRLLQQAPLSWFACRSLNLGLLESE